MKVLWVTSDCAGAAGFEEHFDAEEIASRLTVGGEAKVFEAEGEYYFEAKLLEFGDVDPKFIEFVQSQVQDYDQKKDCNFYVVGTEPAEKAIKGVETRELTVEDQNDFERIFELRCPVRICEFSNRGSFRDPFVRVKHVRAGDKEFHEESGGRRDPFWIPASCLVKHLSGAKDDNDRFTR